MSSLDAILWSLLADDLLCALAEERLPAPPLTPRTEAATVPPAKEWLS